MDISTDETRISFGPRATQTVPIPWAEWILTAVASQHPTIFGVLLRKAVLSELDEDQAAEYVQD